jgi:prepilin-type processing-associated H-X9-DG protein
MGVISYPPIDHKYISLFEALLPYFEQGWMSKYLDLSRREYTNTLGPGSIGATVIGMLLCPSDPVEPVSMYQPPHSGNKYYFGMNSYGGNGGTRSWYVDNMTNDGVFYINSSVNVSQITDGVTNTILFGERFHFDASETVRDDLLSRGGWAWSNYDSAQDYLFSTCVPINFTLGPDYVGINGAYGPEDDRFCAFGSGHQGGANFAMCDGSVRFLTLTSNEDLPLLQALSTRAGGDAVPTDID